MTDSDATSAAEQGPPPDAPTASPELGEVGHVVPLPVLLGVWAALIVLTGATVAVTYVDLGPLNLWVAMLIATVKAGLVALYFMHLRYDHPLYGVLLVSALFFVALFIGLTLIDAQALVEEKGLVTGMG